MTLLEIVLLSVAVLEALAIFGLLNKNKVTQYQNYIETRLSTLHTELKDLEVRLSQRANHADNSVSTELERVYNRIAQIGQTAKK